MMVSPLLARVLPSGLKATHSTRNVCSWPRGCDREGCENGRYHKPTLVAVGVPIRLRSSSARVEVLLLDHDTKFVHEFDALLGGGWDRVKRVGPRAPNLNAYAERWVQSIAAAPGQGQPPASRRRATGDSPCSASAVVCDERLGGLLKHDRRAA